MQAEITSNIQLMGQGGFALLALVLTALTGVGFFLWKKSFQHARVMEDMPTSKVRSAAQGFVELAGSQHEIDDIPLFAPLTGASCTWWSFKVEKKVKSGKQTSWHTVEKDTSVGFFRLRDETGEILVNPLGADVTPSVKNVWYGNARRPTGGVTGFGSAFGRRYRYTERLMRSGEPIYALGHFETWSNVTGSKEREERRAKILAEWKANPAELVRRFDEDGDGRVDMAEWDRAREAAEALVEEHVAKDAMNPDVDVLMRGKEGNPFIISTKSQSELTALYRWKALGGLILFLVGGAALGVSLTARFGG